MKTDFFQFISEYTNITKGSRVVVACSGGADSMCLLNLFLEVRDELNIIVEAAHVNHGIRGSEADSDEEFVRKFCEDNNVQFHCLRVSVPEIAKEMSESIELCARRIRYEFFDTLNADFIATAHTASDRIETMLMNLSRGASLSGLCSIPAVRGKIIRPLIGFTRDDIENYCKIHSLEYVTDSTNLTDDYTRNKFRHNIIGQLKQINPCFEANASKCIRILNKENEYLNRITDNSYKHCLNTDGSLNVSMLKQQDPVITNRVIKHFFELNKICDYESKHIDYITFNLDAEFSLMLPSVKKVTCKNNRLFFDEEFISQVTEEQYIDISKDSVIKSMNKLITLRRVNEIPQSDRNCYFADAQKIGDKICLRSRKSGDMFHLPKRRCTKSLKKLFNELKIPVKDRDSLIVISDENGVIFVEGIGVDSLRNTDSGTKKYLLIKVEDTENE